MSRLARGVTVAAVAIGLGTTSGANAQDVGLDGCYGAGVIVCDPNVHVGQPYRLRWTSTTVPVCVGSCQDVVVPLVTTASNGESLGVCVTYTVDTLGMPCFEVQTEDGE